MVSTRRQSVMSLPSAALRTMVAVTLCLASAATQAATATLWMLTSPGCAACAQFEREVGGLYAQTPESQQAPLRRQALDAPRPAELCGAEPVQGTPTFVLMKDGHEQGRITGYSSDELFWMRLTALLAEIAAKP